MFEIALLIWIVCGVTAGVIASNRGASGCMWYAIGFTLGPIGLIFAFLTGRTCPSCQKTIGETAEVCPYCHTQFEKSNGVTVPAMKQPGFLSDQSTGTPLRSEAASPRPMKKCPMCAEMILEEAEKCRYCGEVLNDQAKAEGQ